ncbi:hypothetical protein QUF75_07085 [Desulfococcaceae bacterium HSG7]|nr:hypothetical protein [Desulfococcaceae bacterium HSG7]
MKKRGIRIMFTIAVVVITVLMFHQQKGLCEEFVVKVGALQSDGKHTNPSESNQNKHFLGRLS